MHGNNCGKTMNRHKRILFSGFRWKQGNKESYANLDSADAKKTLLK